MPYEDTGLTVSLKPGVRGAGYWLLVIRYSESCAVARWIQGAGVGSRWDGLALRQVGFQTTPKRSTHSPHPILTRKTRFIR
jgi:hypothetical protein